MVDVKAFSQSTAIFLIVLLGTLANAAQITAFSDKQFVRTTGAPNKYTETFAAEPGEAVLTIRNGEPGESNSSSYRITSGVISLNGEILFSRNDFKHKTYILEIPVTLQETNTLHIELASKPGDYINLEIIQTIQDPVYDLLASDLQVDSNNCPDSVDISLNLVNNGEDTIPAGTQIAFYNGHPDETGTLIGTVISDKDFSPMEFEAISFQWNNPSVSEAVIYARVDDDGTGTGHFEENDETNNLVSLEAALCQVAPGESSLSGHIIDAVNGDLLANVQVLLHVDNNGLPGAVVASTQSSDDGIYLFPDLAAGSYITTAAHEGYIANQRSVSLGENTQLSNQNIPLSPVLEEDEIRIILTWNDTPADLEAHLTAPSEEGCRYHCYYFNKTIPTASLDLDDRNGYGPETITITDRVSGTYRYYVHDFTNRYSNSYWLSRSGAEVKVFYGDREPAIFTVPSGYGSVWHVFDLDGNTGEITPVNSMSSQSEPGRIDYPTIISGAPGSAYWSSLYTYQVQATDPDNDILTYSLSQAPEGMTINPETGLIEWTPTGAQSGYYYVTLNVDDGRCGEATQTFRIYVNSYPVAQFTVDPCSGYNPGGTITLTWSTTRATTVLIDQGIGEVPASGSLTLPSPDEPIVYTLTAFNDAALTKRVVPANPYGYISFSPRYIYEGDSTTLSWDPRCYSSATLDHGIGEVDGPGSLVITPSETTTYCLTVTNGAATQKYCATVYIQQPPPPPRPTAYLSISPNCNLTPGEPLTLTWSTTNATEITISPDIGDVEPSGSLQVFQDEVGSYTLTATGPGGTVTRTVYYPNYPTLSFWASSYGIDIGDPVTLSWSSSCIDTLVMDQGIGDITPSGSLTVTPDVLPITYTITATNERGPVSRSVTLYQIAPSGRLTADPTIMKVGDSATLTWSSSRATSCSISPDIGPVALNGSMSITPTQPTSYRLTVQGIGGTRTSYASVGFVYPMADLKASALTINEGDTVQLTWIYANATSCSIDQGIGDVELGGERTVAPAATTTYTMTATGPGGTVSDKVTINVIPSGQPPIVSLSASPSVIMHGDSTVLSWNSDYTDTLTIEPDIGSVANTGSATVSPEQTTTYTATATGPGGTIIERELVTVVQSPPAMTLQVEPASVSVGESAVLSWSSSDVDTIVFDQGIGEVSAQGSLTVSPDATTLYTATATGPGGTLTKRVSLNIVHPTPTISFTASPSSIKLGESTTLNWTTENSQTVTIRPGIGEVEPSGTITLSPEQSTTYYLTATGVDSEVVAQVIVTVIQPEPTATLNANPATISLGASSTLSWTTEHARTCSLAPDIGMVDCTGQMAVTPDLETTYILTATGLGGTATDETTVTVTYPVPTATISADPSSITTGESSTLSWSSQYGAICSIAPDIGEVACNGEMTVTPVEDTTYTLTVSNLEENTTADITVSVTPAIPITLAITSPVNATVITRPDVMVTGTVTHSEDLETGVTVNGVIALVFGNQFVANHVPLIEGENTITVRAADVNGSSLEQTVTLTVEPAGRYFKLDTDTKSGLAPLETVLSFDANFTNDEPIDIIYTGPGTVEFTDGTEEDTWNISMTEPGLYTFAVELQDTDGTTYRDEVAVQVYDRSALDALLQGKWDGMKEALAQGQVEDALNYFLEQSQAKYGQSFNALAAHLPSIIANMKEISMIYYDEGLAKYRIKRIQEIEGEPVTITYYIYFRKDYDGVFKIYKF